ncbi:hypothetical protein E2542_SST13867 [Spatholobus suberectus]|nr:hypothetical protein E2542_SST13867 [Spatholobus suberectus]
MSGTVAHGDSEVEHDILVWCVGDMVEGRNVDSRHVGATTLLQSTRFASRGLCMVWIGRASGLWICISVVAHATVARWWCRGAVV